MAVMTWTAPEVDRLRPPTTADERETLDTFLDLHRQTLLAKCAGLTAEQLKTASAPPSNMTLLGLLRHLTEVERAWFSVRAGGASESWRYCSDENPDGDFDDVAQADAEENYAAYVAECETSRQVAAKLPLEHTFLHPRYQKQMSLRWVYVHMIEEYARHNGHADLIRERIDGATGE
jgi:uncharacterized damage-inducible protein DinB